MAITPLVRTPECVSQPAELGYFSRMVVMRNCSRERLRSCPAEDNCGGVVKKARGKHHTKCVVDARERGRERHAPEGRVKNRSQSLRSDLKVVALEGDRQNDQAAACVVMLGTNGERTWREPSE